MNDIDSWNDIETIEIMLKEPKSFGIIPETPEGRFRYRELEKQHRKLLEEHHKKYIEDGLEDVEIKLAITINPEEICKEDILRGIDKLLEHSDGVHTWGEIR